MVVNENRRHRMLLPSPIATCAIGSAWLTMFVDFTRVTDARSVALRARKLGATSSGYSTPTRIAIAQFILARCRPHRPRTRKIMNRNNLHQASQVSLATMLLAATLAANTALHAADAPNQHIAIPAYVGPDTASGRLMFQRLAQNSPTLGIVVINGPHNGPMVPFNAAWADAIKTVHTAGGLVLGYVDTGYYGVSFPPNPAHPTRGGSTASVDWTAQIHHDVDDWYALYGSYGIDGIFFDQSTSTCGPDDLYVDLYAGISDYVSAGHPDGYIVMNPGVAPQSCYASVADTLITFEGSYAAYQNWTPPAWELGSSHPGKFWHLVYAAPDQAAMADAISRSKQRNAGYVYVTSATLDPNPWNGLPADTYWHDELVKVSAAPPSAPDRLHATRAVSGRTSAKVGLAWDSSTDAVAVAGYDVHVGSTQTQPAYSNTAMITGLAPATTYAFSVTARNAAGITGTATLPLSVTTPAAGAPIIGNSACMTANVVTYRATYAESFDYHRVFIDADNNASTGMQGGTPAGIDYMIENSVLYRHAGGGWNWVAVDTVTPLVSAIDDDYVWQVPLSAFGSAATSQAFAINGGGTAPDYTTPVATATQQASCSPP
jgi:hypothetical protein